MVQLKLAGRTLTVEGLKPAQVKQDIQSGVLRGKIEVLAPNTKEEEEQAQITATGAGLRTYVETRAQFVKMLVFEKAR